MGQTKTKVEEKLNCARGGVLFIDEAYELGKGMYGVEAMTSLVKNHFYLTQYLFTVFVHWSLHFMFITIERKSNLCCLSWSFYEKWQI